MVDTLAGQRGDSMRGVRALLRRVHAYGRRAALVCFLALYWFSCAAAFAETDLQSLLLQSYANVTDPQGAPFGGIENAYQVFGPPLLKQPPSGSLLLRDPVGAVRKKKTETDIAKFGVQDIEEVIGSVKDGATLTSITQQVQKQLFRYALKDGSPDTYRPEIPPGVTVDEHAKLFTRARPSAGEWIANASRDTWIKIEPLAPADVAEMIAGPVGGKPRIFQVRSYFHNYVPEIANGGALYPTNYRVDINFGWSIKNDNDHSFSALAPEGGAMKVVLEELPSGEIRINPDARFLLKSDYQQFLKQGIIPDSHWDPNPATSSLSQSEIAAKAAEIRALASQIKFYEEGTGRLLGTGELLFHPESIKGADSPSMSQTRAMRALAGQIIATAQTLDGAGQQALGRQLALPSNDPRAPIEVLMGVNEGSALVVKASLGDTTLAEAFKRASPASAEGIFVPRPPGTGFADAPAISRPSVSDVVASILEAPSGVRVTGPPAAMFPETRLYSANLTVAEARGLLTGALGNLPDRVLLMEPGVATRPGMTFDVPISAAFIINEPNGARTVSLQDLAWELTRNGIRAGSWSLDPRSPTSVGDSALMAEYLGVRLDGTSSGERLRVEIRSRLKQLLLPPSNPADVVVRGGNTFSRAITVLVNQYGGNSYSGEGVRARVVYPDGTVVEYPSITPENYGKIIGDNVAFIEVVGGTATGDAATAIAGKVPADVQAEFNKLNPNAGNEFVKEGVNQVIDGMAEAGKPPVIGGLPIEGIINGQLAVGKKSSFENIREASYEAGLTAKTKAWSMINDVMSPSKGFGAVGMGAVFFGLETMNGVLDQEIEAIAAGNWDKYDSAWHDHWDKVDDESGLEIKYLRALNIGFGIAAFEGAGIGFGALSTAGASLTAGGSAGLGAAASGVGAAGTVALTATGVAFAIAAAAFEINEMGKTATLMDHLDAQAAQVGMADDSWAYSDNAFYRQWQLEAELGTHVIGSAWNAVVDSIKGIFDEVVTKPIASEMGKVWGFDDSFEGYLWGEPSRPNPISPSEAMGEWVDSSAQAGNGPDAPAYDPLLKIPPWLQDLASKGSVAARGLNGLLQTVHDVFPSFVGAPTTRGTDVLKSPAQKPTTTTDTSRLTGTIDRMEDAIRRMNQKEGTNTPPSDDIRLDDLVAQLGTDPQAWSDAFEAGLLSMSDIERVFGRMRDAEPDNGGASPPPEFVGGPSTTVVAQGQPFTLSVDAKGEGLYYVWTIDGHPIPTSDGARFSRSKADFHDAGLYVAYVSDGKVMVQSPPAKVTVVGFVTQPSPRSTAGAGKRFSISAQLSVDNAKYQWMKNGAPVVGATSPTLTIPAPKATDAGIYTLVAKVGTLTVTSDPAAVNVLEVTKDPEFLVTMVGSRATLLASGKVTLASGETGTVTHQWLKNGVVIPSQNSTVLTLLSVQKSDTARYTLKVSHDSASVESAPAHIEVIDRALTARSLTTNPDFTCWIPDMKGGVVECKLTTGAITWGGVAPDSIKGATSIALGARHGCAITAASKVSCWGDGTSGEISPPTDLKGVVSLGLGSTYSCALLNTGLVKCWGSYRSGGPAPGINQVIGLETSSVGICARTLTGDRVCWGG